MAYLMVFFFVFFFFFAFQSVFTHFAPLIKSTDPAPLAWIMSFDGSGCFLSVSINQSLEFPPGTLKKIIEDTITVCFFTHNVSQLVAIMSEEVNFTDVIL